jgi:hypothetical protein
MKFCVKCGAELEMVCPNGGASNSPDHKFCGGCGRSFTSPEHRRPPKDLSFDEKLAKIEKYLPGGLTEKILSQRTKMEGERRHVTTMYVDNDFIDLGPYTKKLLHGIIVKNVDFNPSIFTKVEIERDSEILSLMRPAGSLR